MKIELGNEIYYTGDMANNSGRFEVAAVEADSCTLKELPGGDDRTFRGIRFAQIGHVYAGHCNPRFVTAEARNAYRNRKT